MHTKLNLLVSRMKRCIGPTCETISAYTNSGGKGRRRREGRRGREGEGGKEGRRGTGERKGGRDSKSL